MEVKFIFVGLPWAETGGFVVFVGTRPTIMRHFATLGALSAFIGVGGALGSDSRSRGHCGGISSRSGEQLYNLGVSFLKK